MGPRAENAKKDHIWRHVYVEKNYYMRVRSPELPQSTRDRDRLRLITKRISLSKNLHGNRKQDFRSESANPDPSARVARAIY